MLVEIIINTPWWVFAIFIYVLFIGIRAFWDRKIYNIMQLLTVPLILSGFSLMGLVRNYGFSLYGLNYFLLASLMGIILGYFYASKSGVQVASDLKYIIIPGNFITLILMLLIFSKKYFLGYKYSIDQALKDNIYYMLFDIITSGFLIGILFGRSIYYAKTLGKEIYLSVAAYIVSFGAFAYVSFAVAHNHWDQAVVGVVVGVAVGVGVGVGGGIGV